MSEAEQRSIPLGPSQEQASSLPAQPAPRPATPPSKPLPPWKVLLHNDDVNEVEYVIESVQMITHLNLADALQKTVEAHQAGVSLLVTTHQELAELYQQQFQSRNLTVTIEPGE